jgi:hypothetical protein
MARSGLAKVLEVTPKRQRLLAEVRMMVKIISYDMGDLVFTTRRRIRALDGGVVINRSMEVFGADWYGEYNEIPNEGKFSPQEKIALANYAMELWAEYREKAELEMCNEGEK